MDHRRTKDPRGWRTLFGLVMVLALGVGACTDQGATTTTGSDEATTTVGDDGSATTTSKSTEPAEPVTVVLHHDAGVGPLIEPYIEAFNERYDDIDLDGDFVPQDYYGVTQTQLAAGGVEFDVFFGNPSNTQLWWDSGFLRPLDDFEGVEEVLADLAPGTEDLLRSNEGDLMALPYFTGVELFAYNQAHLDEIGAEAPETWDDVTEIARQLKDAGVVATPISPFWTQDFDIIWWAFVPQVFSDGGEVFGLDGEPLFADDPLVRSVLERWISWYDEGLVPADIFTTSYGDVANIYAGGQSTFTTRYAAELISFADTERSQVAEDTRLGLMPGSTHDSYRWLGTWNLAADTAEPEAAWDVLKYLAWKDRTGEYFVPTNLIAVDLGFSTPYSEVNQSETAQEAVVGWADPLLLAEQVELSRTVPIEKQAWFTEFRTVFAGILQDIVRGNITIDDGLAQAADHVEANR